MMEAAATMASDGGLQTKRKKKHDATVAELAGSSAMNSGWVVNIQSLLQHYDPLYFHSVLCPRVTLSWSGSLKRYATCNTLSSVRLRARASSGSCAQRAPC
jgi:hypothetical protein